MAMFIYNFLFSQTYNFWDSLCFGFLRPAHVPDNCITKCNLNPFKLLLMSNLWLLINSSLFFSVNDMCIFQIITDSVCFIIIIFWIFSLSDWSRSGLHEMEQQLWWWNFPSFSDSQRTTFANHAPLHLCFQRCPHNSGQVSPICRGYSGKIWIFYYKRCTWVKW